MDPELIERLQAVVRGRRFLIVTHNNPDPDAIASTWAFADLLARRFRVDSTIAYGGFITRAENRAMVQILRIDLRPIGEVDLRNFHAAALIDTQPGFRNHALPAALSPSIVIDHHRMHPRSQAVEFSDIRPGYGSTSTIVTEYLLQAGLSLPRRLATALYYGIRSDTSDLGREASEADFRIAISLYPSVHHRWVATIAHPPLSREFMVDFDRALHEARIYGDVILANLGYLKTTDMVARMADFFLQIGDVRWSLVFAQDGKHLVFSLRTKRRKQNAGRMAQRLVKGWGAAGGHDQVAGGQIPLEGFPSSREENLAEAFVRRFLKLVGRDGNREERLLPSV